MRMIASICGQSSSPAACFLRRDRLFPRVPFRAAELATADGRLSRSRSASHGRSREPAMARKSRKEPDFTTLAHFQRGAKGIDDHMEFARLEFEMFEFKPP